MHYKKCINNNNNLLTRYNIITINNMKVFKCNFQCYNIIVLSYEIKY